MADARKYKRFKIYGIYYKYKYKMSVLLYKLAIKLSE